MVLGVKGNQVERLLNAQKKYLCIGRILPCDIKQKKTSQRKVVKIASHDDD